MVCSYEETQSLLYRSNNNEQSLAFSVNNFYNGKPIYAYKIGKIDNIPVSFGESVTYTGLPIKVSFKATDVYYESISSLFTNIEDSAETAFRNQLQSASCSNYHYRNTDKVVLQTNFETSLTQYEQQLFGGNPTVTQMNIESKANTATNEIAYELDYSSCRFGYSYRLTALCNINVYICFYNFDDAYNPNRTQYFVSATSSATSFVLEESNENGVFSTDVVPIDTSALASFDFDQLILDGFYKKCNAPRIDGSYSLATLKNASASFVSRLICRGYRYVSFQFLEEEEDKNEIHIPNLEYTLNNQTYSVYWNISSSDEYLREAEILLDLFTLKDGYSISFNYTQQSAVTIRYL